MPTRKYNKLKKRKTLKRKKTVKQRKMKGSGAKISKQKPPPETPPETPKKRVTFSDHNDIRTISNSPIPIDRSLVLVDWARNVNFAEQNEKEKRKKWKKINKIQEKRNKPKFTFEEYILKQNAYDEKRVEDEDEEDNTVKTNTLMNSVQKKKDAYRKSITTPVISIQAQFAKDMAELNELHAKKKQYS